MQFGLLRTNVRIFYFHTKKTSLCSRTTSCTTTYRSDTADLCILNYFASYASIILVKLDF